MDVSVRLLVVVGLALLAALFLQHFFREPGYIDGHRGVRIDPPEVVEELLPGFWQAGYGIHVHVQGDDRPGTITFGKLSRQCHAAFSRLA